MLDMFHQFIVYLLNNVCAKSWMPKEYWAAVESWGKRNNRYTCNIRKSTENPNIIPFIYRSSTTMKQFCLLCHVNLNIGVVTIDDKNSNFFLSKNSQNSMKIWKTRRL